MKVDVGIEIMVRAFNIHWGRKRKVIRYFAYSLAITIIAFGIWIISKNYSNSYQGYISVFIGITAILLINLNNSIIRWKLNKQYNQMGDDIQNVDMSFDKENLYIKTPKSETKIRWDTFVKWKERDGLILAYRNDSYFQVIPVSQFPENDGLEIRSLLDEHSTMIV